MANELAKIDNNAAVALRPSTAEEMLGQVQLIQRVMKTVMIPGMHYGEIPGCGKRVKNRETGKWEDVPAPVLLKPGAELLLATFRLGCEYKVEDLGDGYDHRYRVTARGFHIPTGNTVGYGTGECSTQEKKYAWRRAVCEAEFDDTPENRRQAPWLPKKDTRGYNIKGEAEQELQVRASPADIANTVLKMACKRALVALCLNATACSDIFEQDLEEEHIADACGRGQQQAPPPPRYQRPQSKQPQQQQAPQNQGGYYDPNAPTQDGQQQQQQYQRPAGRQITEPQRKRLFAIASKAGVADEAVHAFLADEYGLNSANEITMDIYDAVCAWAQGGGQSEPQQQPQGGEKF